MKWVLTILFGFAASISWACDALICQVDPDRLALTQVITFEDQQAFRGPGRLLDDVLVLPGAAFAERFLGQTLDIQGNHDSVTGRAASPLTPLAGTPGETMSLVMMGQNNVLNGYGPAAFPNREGQGEGAIAVLFDRDQPALAFDLRGGEGGHARVQFLRRDGSIIADVAVRNLNEYAVGFTRVDGTADIAGFVLMNDDPQGLAIDNLRFGPPASLG